MFLLLVGGSAFNLFVGLYEELRNIPLAEQGVWGEVLRTESALSLPSAQVPVLTAVMSLSKGKARAELRPARRQARLPHSRSLLLPGRER